MTTQKAVVVEGWEFNGNNGAAILRRVDGDKPTLRMQIAGEQTLVIGDLVARIGDWVVRGSDGAFTVCRRDVMRLAECVR